MHTLKKVHRQHLDKKLLIRLRIYFLLSIVLVGVVGFEILSGRVSLLLALIGLLSGGGIAARMFLVSWNHDAKKVISRLDAIGVGILIAYILISIFRSRIIGYFVEGSYVTGTSISVITGVMIGRVWGTGRKIISILKEQNLFF